MRRKQRLSIFDLGRLPVTPRTNVVEGYETSKESLARFRAEEVAERERPIKQAEQAHVEALRDINRRVKKFYSQPMSELESFSPQSGPVDHVAGDFPLREGNLNCPASRELDAQVLNEFYEDSKTKFTGSQDFWTRFCRYLWPLLNVKGIQPSVPVYYELISRLAYEIEGFNAGELITGTIPRVERETVAPRPSSSAPPLSVDAYRESLASTDERHLNITRKLWAEDFKQWAIAWVNSLLTNFNFVPSDQQLDQVAAWFNRNTAAYSPFSFEGWNAARRWMVKMQYFPDSLLTNSERLSQLIEATPDATTDWATRRELTRQAAEMNKIE